MKFCATCNNTFEDAQSFCPRDGEVLHEHAETIVGQVLEGKYEVESFIAQGGMGAVYRARHILLGDYVVIKTLRSEMRNNAEWLKRFQREGKAARAFRHPNSVTVYDLSAGSDGLIYMVMEYVEGHTLDKELKLRGRFRPEDALEVLEPVADVLDAAHARGVVHRDLKPENVMIGKADDGHEVIKVLDLGIAKMVGAGDVHAAEATSLTVAGQILGTPYYMSPEQWGEMPRDGKPEVDGRADIYSLGVIFFELVAGRKPLGGRTLSELRHEHVAKSLPALIEVAPDVPEAFSRAVGHAMAKDRSDRPPSAGALINELRAALGMPSRGRAAKTVAHDPETKSGGGESVGTRPHVPSGSEAATANLLGGPRTEQQQPQPHLDVSRAETIMTSGMTAATHEGRVSRETSAQGMNPHTEGRVVEVQRERGRATSTSHSLGMDAAAAAAAPSSVHQPQQHAASAATLPAPKRSVMPLVAGGALALLLLAGLGGWLAFRGPGAKTENAPSNVAAANGLAPGTPAGADAPKAEAVSYWLEAFEKPEAETGRSVADTSATLTSGQRFRFHFKPRERGYLYIIGPGAGGNALMTILTAQGAGQLKSNVVSSDADFQFPFGGAKLKLDENPGAEDFTVIFSPKPLLSPSFLAGKFLHELTPAEVKELEDLRAQSKSAGAPALETKGEGGERRVAVSIPESAKGQPVVFDIRINHK
ncbi:MAG: serine/threonine-protein kinase [Acidobacteria bacterium]|nr:serine/threonine-protein kinase [Acidobacteriota bacterium]